MDLQPLCNQGPFESSVFICGKDPKTGIWVQPGLLTVLLKKNKKNSAIQLFIIMSVAVGEVGWGPFCCLFSLSKESLHSSGSIVTLLWIRAASTWL